MNTTRPFSTRLLLLNLCMILFALTALVSQTATYDVARSWPMVIGVGAGVVSFFVAAYGLRTSPLTSLAAGLAALLATAFAVVFIGQYGHQNYSDAPEALARVGRLSTFLPDWDFFIQENSAGTVMELALPLLLALFVRARRGLGLLWAVPLLVCLYALILSYSRGAWLALIAAAVVTLLVLAFQRLRPLAAIVLGAVLVALVVGGGVLLLTVFANQPFVVNLAETAQSRLTLYQNSVMLAADTPFTGIGLGDVFAMVYSRFSLLILVPFLTYAHNLPLSVWLGQGLAGLLAFAGILLLFYAYCWQVVRRARPNALFYGAFTATTASILHGLVDSRQYIEGPALLVAFFFGIGLTVACGQNALARAKEEAPRGSLRRAVLAMAAAVLVLAAVGAVFNQRLLAAWYTNLGAIDEARSDGFILPDLPEAARAGYRETAVAYYQQALTVDAAYPNAHRRLGNIAANDGRYDEAINHLEQALTAEPTYQGTVKGLGLAYLWAGRLDDAETQFRALAERDEMIEELYAWQNFRLERGLPRLSAYALDVAQRLEDSDSPNLNVWALIGQRYAAAGDPEAARRWYDAILAIEPDNALARDGLAALETP